MKKRVSLLVTATVLGGTCAAHAEEAGARGGGPTQKLFAALDLDGDGHVTRSELSTTFQKHLSQRVSYRFHQLDRNGDQRVTASEVGGMAEDRFARFDVDGNGSFTEAELSSVMFRQMQQRVAKLLVTVDADGDQTCSYAELDTHRDRLASRSDESSDRVATREATGGKGTAVADGLATEVSF